MVLVIQAVRLMRNKGSCGFLRKGLQFVESNIIARTGFYSAVDPLS
jgi:hypothetical protein